MFDEDSLRLVIDTGNQPEIVSSDVEDGVYPGKTLSLNNCAPRFSIVNKAPVSEL
jgi:hypothetical protein